MNVITLGKRWIPGRFYLSHMVYFYIKLSRLGARISLLLLYSRPSRFAWPSVEGFGHAIWEVMHSGESAYLQIIR